MKKLIFLISIIFLGTFAGHSQDCPAGMVCISPAAAVQALKDSDEVKAQKVEIAAKDQAIKDLEKIIVDLKIELAKMSGDKTGAEQMIVRLTAIIDFMLKNGRVKKVGLINIF
jgi:hypothetical protein